MRQASSHERPSAQPQVTEQGAVQQRDTCDGGGVAAFAAPLWLRRAEPCAPATDARLNLAQAAATHVHPATRPGHALENVFATSGGVQGGAFINAGLERAHAHTD